MEIVYVKPGLILVSTSLSSSQPQESCEIWIYATFDNFLLSLADWLVLNSSLSD